jgi:hypothetical protein
MGSILTYFYAYLIFDLFGWIIYLTTFSAMKVKDLEMILKLNLFYIIVAGYPTGYLRLQ